MLALAGKVRPSKRAKQEQAFENQVSRAVKTNSLTVRTCRQRWSAHRTILVEVITRQARVARSAVKRDNHKPWSAVSGASPFLHGFANQAFTTWHGPIQLLGSTSTQRADVLEELSKHSTARAKTTQRVLHTNKATVIPQPRKTATKQGNRSINKQACLHKENGGCNRPGRPDIVHFGATELCGPKSLEMRLVGCFTPSIPPTKRSTNPSLVKSETTNFTF